MITDAYHTLKQTGKKMFLTVTGVMGIPVNVNADSSGKPERHSGEGEQQSERSDASVVSSRLD